MYRQFYQGMELTHLPLFALLLFVVLFLGIVAWAFVLRRGQDFEALAHLPLAESDRGEPSIRRSRGHE